MNLSDHASRLDRALWVWREAGGGWTEGLVTPASAWLFPSGRLLSRGVPGPGLTGDRSLCRGQPRRLAVRREIIGLLCFPTTIPNFKKKIIPKIIISPAL